jgi:hypothetical protein
VATTNYYVLSVSTDSDDTLVSIGEAEAGTGEAAIRKVAAEGGLALDGRFVAVPVRNWTEIEFEVVEREPTVKANYLSERARRAPQPIPGQVSIEEEIEADVLAAEIEGVAGEDLPDLPLTEETEEVPA